MDLLTYDPALPELPLLRAFPRAAEEAAAPRFDWAGFVIRLARAVAERDDDRPAA